MAAQRIENRVAPPKRETLLRSPERTRVVAGIVSLIAFPLVGILYLAGVVDELLYVLIALSAIGILVAAGR